MRQDAAGSVDEGEEVGKVGAGPKTMSTEGESHQPSCIGSMAGLDDGIFQNGVWDIEGRGPFVPVVLTSEDEGRAGGLGGMVNGRGGA
jgi:hypothetical protein